MRQRLSAERRRIELFEATVEVMAGKGYADSTLTAIAESAGVAKGLVWHYFDDRDDLMRQALSFLTGRIHEAVVSNLDLSAPVRQVIADVFANTAALTRTHSAELETIDQIVHNLRTPDGRQRVTMLDYESTYAEHEALIRRGQADGSLLAGNSRVIAVTYQGVIDSMIGYLQAHPHLDSLTYATTVSELFLTGITARSHTEPQSVSNS